MLFSCVCGVCVCCLGKLFILNDARVCLNAIYNTIYTEFYIAILYDVCERIIYY